MKTKWKIDERVYFALQLFVMMNKKGREKTIEYIKDLLEIEKYQL